ncbi:GTP-binding protein, partial [Synechococcus sp. 1G10]|uniref:GTP-binding protein n=1 Tax=Synechococcus sp. 1G10 TaxID=2025605 RepID=UPI001180A20D
PLALEDLRDALRKLPATVYRAKGVAYVADALEEPAVLQVVGKRVEISFQNEWGQRRPHTRVVVIGAANGIEPKSLRQLFEKTVVLN